jgi:UPF0755 protein
MTKIVLVSAIAVLCILGLSFFLVNRPPSEGSSYPKTVTIGSGSFTATINTLKASDLVRSPQFFNFIGRVTGASDEVKSGVYLFNQPVSALELLARLRDADYGVKIIKVTIPEGLTTREIASTLKKSGMLFSEEDFLKVASKKEGYLFPDTYEFRETETPEEVTREMEVNFVKKVEPLLQSVDDKSFKLQDVVKMASIVEEEATTELDRKKVAGILWKRLKAGMPLQVDAAFAYVMAKSTWTLTTADLQVDSPYNTYRYKGLPPTPITNPGFSSISSTVAYTETPYLFYLSDKEGNMYYARTYTEHKANIEKYLR